MKCSQCGSDAATGAGTCPGCGAAIPTAAEAATLTQAGPALAFRFDAARWTMADRIAGGATLVLFISLFLPWFSVSAGFGNFTASSSVDALTAHGYLYLVLLLALAMLGYLIVSAGLDSMPALPLSHEQILGAAAAVNLLLVAHRHGRHARRRLVAGQGELGLRRVHRAGRRDRGRRPPGRRPAPRPVQPHRVVPAIPPAGHAGGIPALLPPAVQLFSQTAGGGRCSAWQNTQPLNR